MTVQVHTHFESETPTKLIQRFELRPSYGATLLFADQRDDDWVNSIVSAIDRISDFRSCLTSEEATRPQGTKDTCEAQVQENNTRGSEELVQRTVQSVEAWYSTKDTGGHLPKDGDWYEPGEWHTWEAPPTGSIHPVIAESLLDHLISLRCEEFKNVCPMRNQACSGFGHRRADQTKMRKMRLHLSKSMSQATQPSV